MASITPKIVDEGFDTSNPATSPSAKGLQGHEPAHDSEPYQLDASEAPDKLETSGITTVDHAEKDDTKTESTSMLDIDGAALQDAPSEDVEPVASDFESINKSVNDQPKKSPQKSDQQQPTLHRMHKFTLYETNARYWITGSDITDKYYKLLKIDRTAPPGQLSVFEDEIVYSKQEVTQLLTTIDDGNKATGGLRVKCSFWGILGFIRLAATTSIRLTVLNCFP
jgi:hypothetical protein